MGLSRLTVGFGGDDLVNLMTRGLWKSSIQSMA